MGQAQRKTIDDFVAEGHTPVMAQYMAIKDAHPDALVFFRMGDFYELFYDDAVKAAETLDITLTKRGKSNGDDIPMCGVPFHACEPYLAKLIKSGFKVAIAEQTETPAEAKERVKAEGKPASKALVNRDVVRVVTQGTLTEDTLLDARENNYIASLSEIAGQFGVAWLELSTGAFFVQPCDELEITAALERIAPSEIVLPAKLEEKLETIPREVLSPREPSLFDSENARKRLEKLFGVGTLESYGGFSRAEISAAGALVDYITRTQAGNLPHIAAPQQITSGAHLEIDAATRRNLELTRTLTGGRKGSLLDCIDRSVTAAGARLLQSWLSAPLMDINAINARLARVALFAGDNSLRDRIREQLKSVPDMERALSRLTVGRGGPRDLAMIRDGLKSCEILRAQLQSHNEAKTVLSGLLDSLKQKPELAALQDHLQKSIMEEPPALLREGGFVREGYHARLDELKTLKSESKRLIAGLQGRYQKETKIDKLKISYNNVLGYFIEVTAKNGDALMNFDDGGSNPFVHRQTMANAMRFVTPQLAELERDISSAGEKSLALELEIFENLRTEIAGLSGDIGKTAQIVAMLDVASGLAALAIERDYTQPILSNDNKFNIEGGRHPVVEAALSKQSESFVPNDCDLSGANALWLLTGPNMAGKSTFLRQNALITIMAQMGAFVPAASAQIGIVDRVFSRVGASDDLARGRSTFMVEMVETAAILNMATENSLVILDEIGRGTATFDGLSIAWACVEHLHEVNKCRGLFATHYHELTALTSKLANLSSHSMQVKEWKGDIIFMHSVGAGSADRSYGIHVGKLAGLPKPVLARAEEVLKLLQSGEQSGSLAKLADDLPLFSSVQASAEDKPSALEEALSAIDPDGLSPKEALEVVYKLKGLI